MLLNAYYRFDTFAVEGNSYHSSTATIRFEGDVILFASSASSLSHILPFLSKATVVSTPLVYISRNASSPNRFHIQHDALPPAAQGALARIRPSGAKFAPTVALMNCSAGDLDVLFRDASAQNALMTDLVAILRALSADGAVLDMVSCLGREQALHTKPQMHRLLSFLGSALLRKKMLSILSVPPIKGSAVVDPQVFAAADFEALEYSFSFFHVPFSVHELPSASTMAGPRAPLAWIIKTIRAMLPSGSVKTKRAGKLLASIDMRAAVFNKSGGWYVHSDELVKLLLNNTGGRCMWDADAMEHSCQPHLLSCFLHSFPHRHIQRPRSTARNVSSVSERPASECGCPAVACHLTSPPLRRTTLWQRNWAWASDGPPQTAPPQCSSICCKVEHHATRFTPQQQFKAAPARAPDTRCITAVVCTASFRQRQVRGPLQLCGIHRIADGAAGAEVMLNDFGRQSEYMLALVVADKRQLLQDDDDVVGAHASGVADFFD